MGSTPPPIARGRTRATHATRSEQRFFQATTDEHATMDQIAEETGGKAFYNTNGLAQAVETAMDEGSDYYTVTYVPENRKWDGSFRTIKVTGDRPGLRLAYRRGYYADNPKSSVFAPKSRPISYVDASMMFGGPQPTEIPLDVEVDPAADVIAVAPEGNHLAPVSKPPYRRYTILIAADARNVTFIPIPGGSYRPSVEFVSVVYDADGQRASTS